VPSARVLVLTTYDGDDDVLPALTAGAICHLLKDSPREEVFRAVRAAAAGETVLLISETTVKTHLAHIYTKPGVSDRASAVATAYGRGLLP